MKPQKALLLICLALLNLPAAAQQIEWLKNYKEASELAQRSGKPMVLDFWAEWCGPCKVMESQFWNRADVIAMSDRFVFVKVDVDENRGLKTKFGVGAIPHVLLTDSWGLPLMQEVGYGSRSGQDILAKLRYMPTDFEKMKDARNLLEKEKTNVAALTQVADFYHEKKFYFQSIDFYERILKLETDGAKREDLMLKIGFNYLRSNAPGEALDIFDKFQKEFPQSPKLERVLYGRVAAYQKKNKMKEAQKHLAQLKTAFPESKLIAEAEKLLGESK